MDGKSTDRAGTALSLSHDEERTKVFAPRKMLSIFLDNPIGIPKVAFQPRI
jgi:hypothetical protein